MVTREVVLCSCGNKCTANQRLLTAVFGGEVKCTNCSEVEVLKRTGITVNGVPLEEYLDKTGRNLL